MTIIYKWTTMPYIFLSAAIVIFLGKAPFVLASHIRFYIHNKKANKIWNDSIQALYKEFGEDIVALVLDTPKVQKLFKNVEIEMNKANNSKTALEIYEKSFKALALECEVYKREKMEDVSNCQVKKNDEVKEVVS